MKQTSKQLPTWKSGELAIHFIQTGCGEQTFFQLPDGTTMLVDCGDFYRPHYLQYVPLKPDGTRFGGELVSRYLHRLLPDEKAIDYFVLTHWHADHCGGPDLRCEYLADGRRVCGITRLAEDFQIRNYFDHQYPKSGLYRHNPDDQSLKMMQEWIPLMRNERGMKCHSFDVGALDQIRMLRGGYKRYRKTFSIRNLHANCVYWDGHGGKVDFAPEFIKNHPECEGGILENSLSLGFRLDYGKFSAYFGGDIDDPQYESILAPIIGKVTIAKMNHHGCPSSMGRDLCRNLQARVYVGSTWSPNQITDVNLVNMASRELYPGPRWICPGYLPEIKKRAYAGRDFMNDIPPVQGHVVIKVAEGGKKSELYILTDEDESMSVIFHDFI